MSEVLVSRELLEKLERLTLRWLRSHQGVLGGYNRSRLPGYGHEFLDHRNFYAGDDLRAVNWRAYLRFERFLLKTFELEPRVPIRLLLDVSASMSTGNKFDYARRLALALTYVALVKHDTVILQPFTSTLFRPILATGGRHRIHQAESFLRDIQPGGLTDLRAVARSFLSAHRTPGLVVILSDFVGEHDVLPPLQNLADNGHELLLIQIWNWNDRYPDFSGAVELIDSETGAHRRVQIDADASRAYTRRVEAHTATLKRMAARNTGRFIDLCTRTPVDEALFGPLQAVIGRSR